VGDRSHPFDSILHLPPAGKNAQLERLPKDAPDLADRVEDESLSLAAAMVRSTRRTSSYADHGTATRRGGKRSR
jgi:hypothetical protein